MPVLTHLQSTWGCRAMVMTSAVSVAEHVHMPATGVPSADPPIAPHCTAWLYCLVVALY